MCVANAQNNSREGHWRVAWFLASYGGTLHPDHQCR